MLGVDVDQVPVIQNQVGDLHGKQYRRCLVSELQEPRRIQCVNSSSFQGRSDLQRGRHGRRTSTRTVTSCVHFTNHPVLLAREIHRLLRVRVHVCKRSNSQKEVLHLNHPTIQVLADIFARARSKKNESVGAVRPVGRASMVCALSTQNG